MKRFTDTEKWSDPWFRKLSITHKAFWSYICDKCDNAGVWKPDFELASFCIGEAVSEQSTSEAFKERVEISTSGAWLIRKFVRFQFGELNPSCRPHQSVLDLLYRQNIPYSKGMHTLSYRVQEGIKTGKGLDKDKDQDKGGVGDFSEVELPPNFPATEKDASSHAAFVGCDEVFATGVWNKARGRGGRDSNDVPVRMWRNYLATEWSYEQNRRAKPTALNGKVFPRDIDLQMKAIQKEIDEHPANPQSVCYKRGCDDLTRNALKMLRDKIKSLNSLQASGGVHV